jgi:broad specificity phosphatase PhoE
LTPPGQVLICLVLIGCRRHDSNLTHQGIRMAKRIADGYRKLIYSSEITQDNRLIVLTSSRRIKSKQTPRCRNGFQASASNLLERAGNEETR